MDRSAGRFVAGRWLPLGAAAALLAAACWLGAAHGWRQGALWLLGAAFGAVLFQASFSFAGGFRALLVDGRGRSLRAQMLLLGLMVVLMLPAIEAGSLAGAPVRGIVFPAGVAVLLGAFLFGVGMQLGGGCASGTLYTVGGGSTRMALTLAFFVTGATVAAWDAERWQDLPALPAMTLAELVGLGPAMLGSLIVFGAVAGFSWRAERRLHGVAEPLFARARGMAMDWPLTFAAIALALLNLATLWLAGRPWVITAAFPLWGSRAVEALGWDDPAFWPFWEDPTRAEAILRPILADRTTAMDLGLIAGAMLTAMLAGRFAPRLSVLPKEAAASAVGGLLLGYGAVMASGCNISAYLAGIASSSLHGWAWILPALAGNWAGVKLRPLFGLRV